VHNKIRVLQLGKYFEPFKGGIELVSYELGCALNTEKIKCDVLCFNHDDNFHNTNAEFKIIRTRSLFKIASTTFSWEYIKKLRTLMGDYDILHVHLPNPMAHLAIMLCQPKAKLVLHWHSDIINQKILELFYAPFLKRLIRKSSAVIGATPAHVYQSDYSHFFSNKSFVIPYIFNHHKLASIPVDYSAVRRIVEKYRNRKIIFSVGRHVYYKGFGDLVETGCHLPDDWVILIGGTGPDTKYLQSQIDTLNLQNKVVLVGRLSDAELIHYLDASKIFAFPSVHRSEMFGMVQLEAFARSKPVVSTNISRSGVPYINKSGFTGFSVPINKPDELAAAILAVSDDESYQKFCEQAKSWLVSSFDLSEIVSKHMDVYERVINENL
jgi:glycosyltransferase involved in cell wall biosynthesis